MVLPAAVNFGFVSLNASNHPIGFPARNVLLISDGQTPLLVPSLALDDPDVGFQLGIRDPGGLQPAPVTPGVAYQVAPGDAMIIEVRFIPARVGPAETRLVAVTNAGRFETRCWVTAYSDVLRDPPCVLFSARAGSQLPRPHSESHEIEVDGYGSTVASPPGP